MIRKPAILIVALLLTLLVGCLISEHDEIRLTINKDGKSGVLEFTRTNIQSDESTPEKQKRDFDELISNWQSDSYLIEKMSEGYYVKDRSLRLEKGVLVWKQQLLFGDIRKILDSDIARDTLRFRLEHSDIIASTNGTVRRYADSTVVLWPITPGTFQLKLKRSQFTPTSDFVGMFKKYLLTKKKPSEKTKR